VAYDSLLYARRRELHRLIAQGIETLYADRLDEYVASLAHHYLEAEEWARAFHYQHRAGERAQALFANKDAVAYFRTALTIAAAHLSALLTVIESAEFVQAMADVQERLGDVLLLEGRYDEVLEAYETARNLLTQDSPPAALVKFYRKTAEVYERKADYPLALEWLEQGLVVLGDQEGVETARIYNLGGGVFYRQGEREKALEWLQQGLRVAERLNAQNETARAYLIMAMTYAELGDTDRALTFGRRCLEAYEAAGDLAGSVKARTNLGIISRRAGAWTQAVEHYREGLRLSEAMGDVMQIGMIANNMGNVYLEQGQLEQAAAAYERSIAVLQPIGFLGGVAAVRLNLGKVAVTQGDLETGALHLSEALTLAQEIGTRLFLPEIYHWQALLHLARREHQEALALAGRAYELARELKDRNEEGATLRVLGQIYAALGQPQQAIERLSASLVCFTELKSTYQAAQTRLQLGLVYLEQADTREQGRGLLDQARTLFAGLGAQWDLAQTEKAIEQFLAQG
jgi:tetratricopeptide (TPR) repeat protein